MAGDKPTDNTRATSEKEQAKKPDPSIFGDLWQTVGKTQTKLLGEMGLTSGEISTSVLTNISEGKPRMLRAAGRA